MASLEIIRLSRTAEPIGSVARLNRRDLRLQQRPDHPRIGPTLVMRIVPNRREQPNDHVGSDWQTGRVRHDGLAKLEAVV